MSTPPIAATGAAPPRHATAPPAPAPAGAATLTAFAEGDTPSFWDLLDVINPLQHIPIVNSLYREMTGDTIGTASRLAGGTLFGGLIGFGASLASLVLEGVSGRDVGGHVLALFNDEAAPAPALPRATATAAAEPRFLPVPPRGSRAVPAMLPYPAAAPAAAPPAPGLQRAVAAQGLQDADHPLLKERGRDAGTPAWFENTVLDAMDKYQRGARLGTAPADGR